MLKEIAREYDIERLLPDSPGLRTILLYDRDFRMRHVLGFRIQIHSKLLARRYRINELAISAAKIQHS